MRVVGECFFWYRLTRVFPDKFLRAVKRLCVVCVCVVLPFWCRLTQVVPDRIQEGRKMVVCMCVCVTYNGFNLSVSDFPQIVNTLLTAPNHQTVHQLPPPKVSEI